MKKNPHSYHITITFLEDDDVYEATVQELPDIREYGDSPREVYELALDTIDTYLRAFDKSN